MEIYRLSKFTPKKFYEVDSWLDNLLLILSYFFQAIMKLFTNPNGGDGNPRPGVMIPIPQYPLYSASLAEYNIDQVRFIFKEI
jgi:hypothetical protein